MNTQEKIEYDDYMKNLVVTKGMIETAKLECELIGEVKGEVRGTTEANHKFTISLITNTDFNNEKIAMLVGVDATWVAEIKKECKLLPPENS